MAKLEDNVVPIIVLDDDDEMAESASKLADSRVNVGFEMKRVECERFVVPTVGAENVIPNSGETGLVDGVGVKVNGLASLNDCVVSEQEVQGNEGSYLVDGISEEHGFLVGDLVWCKIKNDPWFPAQVYDSKDASEFALKYRQEGRLLVAFFGDGSCSWCLPSQLLPFVENFVELSGVCDSTKFLNAIQKAVDEFGRIVESGMVCKCVPKDRTGDLARPLAENFGVKSGVLVPEVEVKRLSVPKYESREVLAGVRDFAKTVSIGNIFHLAILKSRLSAFYRFKGGYRLPLYDEPVYIEGLEEKEQISSPVNDFSPISSVDIIYQRRQKKDLAEIMGENVNVGPESEGSFWARKISRKRNAEFLHMKSEIFCEVSVDTDPVSRKLEGVEVIAGEVSTADPKQELHSKPRERKKSKYLSPPYTTLIGNEELNTKIHFTLSDVEIPVNELLVKIQFAAARPLYLSNKYSFDKLSSFVSAMKRSTYLHGPNYKTRKCITGPKQKKKQLSSQGKLSPASGATLVEMDSSWVSGGFISDVKFVTRELEIMTLHLQKSQTKLSVEEKASLKEDIKQIMEHVVNTSEKVEAASEKVRTAEEEDASFGRN